MSTESAHLWHWIGEYRLLSIESAFMILGRRIQVTFCNTCLCLPSPLNNTFIFNSSLVLTIPKCLYDHTTSFQGQTWHLCWNDIVVYGSGPINITKCTHMHSCHPSHVQKHSKHMKLCSKITLNDTICFLLQMAYYDDNKCLTQKRGVSEIHYM